METFAELTARLVSRPYRLGEVDCFSTILVYLQARRVPLPAEFEGQTRHTYPDLYKTDPEGAKALAIRFLESVLDEVPPHTAIAGDILVLRLPGNPPFLAIDGGNGQVVAASVEHGVRPLAKRHYKVERCFRCPRPCH